MNAERQIIGSLLLEPTRIEEMHLINSEMFKDTLLGDIFSLYEHAEGKEINPLYIAQKLQSDFMTEKQLSELLVDIVTDHDSGVSDRYCLNLIFDEYRVRKFDEFLNHVRLNPQTIDDTFQEFKESIDSLQKPDDTPVGTKISELTKYKDEYFRENDKKHLNLGFAKIDRAIGGMDDGDVIIIAARPAVGKSALALQMIRKFGKDGYKVGYFNLEMAERQIYERSIAAVSGIDMTRIRLATNFLGDEYKRFEEGNKILESEKNVTTITGTQSINTIRATQNKAKFDCIVIDYLQLIQSSGKRANRASEVGDISRGLKAIATDFNIPVIALSQLNRASEMNKDKEPTMSELRESGDIEQDASVILMLWNPNPEDRTEKKIKVEKSRNGYIERDTIFFDGKHMTFSTVDVNEGFRDESTDESLPWN